MRTVIFFVGICIAGAISKEKMIIDPFYFVFVAAFAAMIDSVEFIKSLMKPLT